MSTALEDKLAKDKQARKLLVTLVVSAPIILWLVTLFN